MVARGRSRRKRDEQMSRWPTDATRIGTQFCDAMERAINHGNLDDARVWSRQIQALITAHGNYRGEPVRERWLDLTERLHSERSAA